MWESKIVTPYLNFSTKFIEDMHYLMSLFSVCDMFYDSSGQIILQKFNLQHITWHQQEQGNAPIS